LKQSDYFGDIAVRHQTTRTSTIVTLENCDFAVMHFDTFHKYIGESTATLKCDYWNGADLKAHKKLESVLKNCSLFLHF